MPKVPRINIVLFNLQVSPSHSSPYLVIESPLRRSHFATTEDMKKLAFFQDTEKAYMYALDKNVMNPVVG